MRLAIAVGVVAVLATLLPVSGAFACSCAQPSLEEVRQRSPEAVVAVVRRVDPGGGRVGTGQVLATLHGSAPERLPIQLDDGASCKPSVAPGQLAALTFVPRGDAWETVDCGMLDLGAAIARLDGALAPDPAATGPPAMVVAGSLPAADLATLDAELRVLATTDLGEEVWLERMVPCGDHLVTIARHDLDTIVQRRTLPQLEVVAATTLRHPEGWRVLTARCAGGKVLAVGAPDGFAQPARLHLDLLAGAEPSVALPAATAAAFVGDDVWLLVGERDGADSRIEVVDPATGAVRAGPRFPGFQAGELYASPTGSHVAVRGFDEQPALLVLDAASFAVTGRSRGWLMPTGGGWLDDEHLVLVDESAAGGTPLRVTDVALRVQAELEASGWVLGLGAGTAVVGGGRELTVLDRDGMRARSGELGLVPADQALVLAAAAPGELVGGPDDPDVPPAVPPVAGSGRDLPMGLLAVLAGITAASLLVAAITRRAR